MNKHWIIEGSNKAYPTYEEAEKQAKRQLAGCSRNDTWNIYELVAAVVQPLPVFEVVKVQ